MIPVRRPFFLNRLLILLGLPVLLLSACKDSHVSEHPEWAATFKAAGIDSACFILRDHSHELVNVYNRNRCLQRFTPASTFKILNSLVALETSVARDGSLVIPWDGVIRGNTDWNHDMDMREAFRVSNVAYYQEIARRVGRPSMQHYLDTVKYGNMRIGDSLDQFWLNNTLQISADEQLGFVKKLYFDELPFIVRNQSIVKNMMLREDTLNNRLYYKTGTGMPTADRKIYWIVGFMEHYLRVKEDPKSMNKSGVRNYPYFFAMNFELPAADSSKDWSSVRLSLLHKLLDDYGATRDQ